MKIRLSTLALALAMGGEVEAQVVRPAPTNDKDQAWSNMVIYAMRQSAQAHNGVAEYGRKCAAATMVCANSIAYYNEENKIIVLMRRETLDGKGIGRYVCVPNEHIDVEFCVNFDT